MAQFRLNYLNLKQGCASIQLFYLEVLHPSRVDDGIEQGLEDNEAVEDDADGGNDLFVDLVLFEGAVFAVDDEPKDGRHPAHDERADYQQRRDDRLLRNSIQL